MEHEFTAQILDVLRNDFGDRGVSVFEKSHLLQYLNIKTRSAERGSKSRGSFANLYAIYVLVEDYYRRALTLGRAITNMKAQGSHHC